ncbi:MAG: DUF4159 domain-containing protein [Proteobacteria bacterium]|nr:DUF4159 domain-containing protein [Pseudomonadota bacterium]
MMPLLQSIGFGTPVALLALLALPLIWWLLRFTPPKPKALAFPPIRILLGLPRQEETPDKTPWWLLLLRLALAALVIFVVAQPFHQPPGTGSLPGGTRLVIVDDGWASASHWSERRQSLIEVLEDAQARGDSVMLATTAPSARVQDYAPVAARSALDRARSLRPSPLTTDRNGLLNRLKAANLESPASIIWLSDGLQSGSAESFAEGLRAYAPSATLRVLAPSRAALPLALGPARLEGQDVTVDVLRPEGQPAATATVAVRATNGRILTEVPVTFTTAAAAKARISLPTALRNEIQAVTLSGETHAGAKQLFDDRWRKRTIALMTAESVEVAQPLLSPLHYVSRGLEPFAELYEPQTPSDLSSLIDAGLSMLVLADVGQVPDDVAPKVADWVEKGGILLRFAGPHVAAAHDDLMPVTLREGDRTLGSALSWETPQGLQPFPETSPFAGLTTDPRVTVSRQVLAEPDADLPERTWASLSDGTPLVTARKEGKGLIVLFHVTSNANWSNLPLSGLFLQMLQRIAGLDPAQAVTTQADPAAGYAPRLVMTGEGDLVSPDGTAKSIPTVGFDSATPTAATPPGLYARGGDERALNLALTPADLTPFAASLSGTSVSSYEPQAKTSLVPYVAMGAVLLFLLDCLATVFLGGGLARLRNAPAVILAALLVLPLLPQDARAQQTQADDMQAALSPRLAYVRTGDDEIDRTSAEGLKGLSLILSDRTSAALAEPMGVNVDSDELVFYPLLYWPVREDAQSLSEATRTKVSQYMKNGGTIFFDLRDGGIDFNSGAGAALRRILDKVDVPPLEPVPDNHVLTRTFYLLTSFPGRYEGAPLWVESGLGEVTANPGTADGVSSVIIGGNDYAAAWALDDNGQPLYAVVPGSDRQREFAFRTGINIVMYALTGNYKADQVHVPALLERLGQ